MSITVYYMEISISIYHPIDCISHKSFNFVSDSSKITALLAQVRKFALNKCQKLLTFLYFPLSIVEYTFQIVRPIIEPRYKLHLALNPSISHSQQISNPRSYKLQRILRRRSFAENTRPENSKRNSKSSMVGLSTMVIDDRWERTRGLAASRHSWWQVRTASVGRGATVRWIWVLSPGRLIIISSSRYGGMQSETWRRSMSLCCSQLPRPMVIPSLDILVVLLGRGSAESRSRGSSTTLASGHVDRADR